MTQVPVWLTDGGVEYAIKHKGDLTLSRYLSKILKEVLKDPEPQTINIDRAIEVDK